LTEQKKNAPKLSIYIPEELRTRFKIACAAEQTSMNQVLADFIEQWTDEHDPMRKAMLSAQQQDKPPTASTKGTGGKGKGE
jgi:hypothetical protein